jgi:hypothetical protein
MYYILKKCLQGSCQVVSKMFQMHLPKVINQIKISFVMGRSIFGLCHFHVCKAKEWVFQIEKKLVFLLLIDFEKVLYWINGDFIFTTLQTLKINNLWNMWVSTLYKFTSLSI